MTQMYCILKENFFRSSCFCLFSFFLYQFFSLFFSALIVHARSLFRPITSSILFSSPFLTLKNCDLGTATPTYDFYLCRLYHGLMCMRVGDLFVYIYISVFQKIYFDPFSIFTCLVFIVFFFFFFIVYVRVYITALRQGMEEAQVETMRRKWRIFRKAPMWLQ